MSATDKAFAAIKNIMLHQQRMDGLEERLTSFAVRLERLAESHAALRDRVSRIEGVIEGAAMASKRNAAPRIEG